MSEVEENPISSPEKNKNNKSNLILIFLLMISFAGIAYLVWDLNNKDANYAELKKSSDAVKKEKETTTKILKDSLVSMIKEYDKLIEIDVSRKAELDSSKQKVIENLLKIEKLEKTNKINYRQLLELSKENETLRGIMRGYIKEIDKLNTLNSELRSDLDRTESKLDSTSSERDQYKKEAELRNEQVKKGSVLSAYEFSTTGMRLKMNKTTTETNKARNTIQIKCAFQIGSNPIASAGEKTIYMQVLDANNKVLQYRSNAIFTYQNETLPYSEKRSIDYQNKSINVSIYYDLRGKKLSKGVYKTKIFCDGSLIGTDTFALK